jgi:tRNA-dihydrouridine synthase 3
LVPVNRDASKKKRQLQEEGGPTSDSKRQHIEGGSSSNEKSNDITEDDQSEAGLTSSLVTIAEGKQNAEKGGRGKWEKKPKPQRREKTREAVGICFIVATKGLEACTHGERCKFNHDVAAYLAAKLPDLEGKCPSFEQTGE